METMRAIFKGTFPGVDIPEMSPEEYMKAKVDWYNKTIGSLNEEDGIECDICLNKGYIQTINEGSEQPCVIECYCMKQRRAVKAMQSSGLGGLIDKSFDNYHAETDWQERAKRMAVEFSEKPDKSWLYFGGMHGSGKTHLCTAVCKELINQGRTVKYLLWGEINQKLNALKYRYEESEQYLDELKRVEVLYIDDFLKTATGQNNRPEKPGREELHNAYTVINARYFANKKTLISSEHFIAEYEDFDGAAAGRIKEKSSALILIDRSDVRNYRKKGMVRNDKANSNPE